MQTTLTARFTYRKLIYLQQLRQPRVGSARSTPRPPRRYARITTLALLSLVVVAGLVYVARLVMISLPPDDALAVEATTEATATRLALLPAVETSTPTDAVAATPTDTPIPQIDTIIATPAPIATPSPTRPRDSTDEIVALRPRSAIWWASNDARRNRRNDSFLYAGAFEGQEYLSAVQFDLSVISRGAPIQGASLNLTGLRQDGFDAATDATWKVQLIAEVEDAPESITRADFIGALTVDSISLLPELSTSDLAVGQENVWEFNEIVRAWLTKQIIDQRTSVYARITALTSGEETLFAWDSGLGSQTSGKAPRLVLNMGPPPTKAPPTPTIEHIVATLTPTPASEFTVVAQKSNGYSDCTDHRHVYPRHHWFSHQPLCIKTWLRHRPLHS